MLVTIFIILVRNTKRNKKSGIAKFLATSCCPKYYKNNYQLCCRIKKIQFIMQNQDFANIGKNSISIIICSRNRTISNKLKENIEKSIGGGNYEIVWIDNSNNKYTICQAYNMGVQRAKYEYLCFMHEDIIFLSDKWGELAIEELSKPDVWLLGILGTKFIDVCSTYWWPSPCCCGHNWYQGKEKCFSKELSTQEVVAVDGMWLFSHKRYFKNSLLRWDDSTYTWFDFYDMDISMQVKKQGGKIIVVPSIYIEHGSEGNYSIKFYEECLKFHKKWDAYLPLSVSDDDNIVLKNNKIILERICKLEANNTKLKKLFTLIPYRIARKWCKFFNIHV